MKEQSKKPLFITFEGGEGAGKTTLITQIAGYLEQNGYSVLTTREPGGSKLGEFIRHWLLHRDFAIRVDKEAEMLLFLAARAQHLSELIVPALKQGQVVLCDRFNDSTIVYQGIARGIGADKVAQFCSLVTQGSEPDLTFYLDVDPVEGLKRTARTHKDTASEGNLDRIESEAIDFHKKVREGFLALAKQHPNRIRPLDAHQTQENVLKQAIAILDHVCSHT